MIKKYNELEFTDDFMFCKILTSRLDLCKELLELILGIKLKKVCLSESQKVIEMKYDSRGIRLDVYVDDENETIYDLEMQTTLKKDIPKRMRYYQGMIDLNLIQRGESFSKLKKSYIIFICTKDPFGKKLPIYTFENTCIQDKELILGDETTKVVVNPDSNRAGLSPEMNEFLNLLQGKKPNKKATKLVREITEAVKNAKEHKEWEVDYMTLQLKLQEEREEGREEGREQEILLCVQEGDISIERGAQKLGISKSELICKMKKAGFNISSSKH